MKFEIMMDSVPAAVEAEIRRAVESGASGAWTIETKHDPFLLLVAAAAIRTDLRLGTAVAVAFARNPMVLANTGYDMQYYTRGNFVLGLGTQVKPHITRRFSMPWDKPVARMREMVAAMHAIWDTWEGKGPLKFRGDFYSHTLMTPAFSPEPHSYGRPPIMLGGLGPAMTSLAGEIADGFVVHRFMTRKFLSEVTLPRLEEGRVRRKTPESTAFQLVFPPFYAAPSDPALMEEQIASIKRQIAFYASTPAYSPVLELHGWDKLGPELHALSVHGEWDKMASLVSDEMVEEFAVVCSHDGLHGELTKRYGDLVDAAILFPETS